jgi:K+-transporting ATPase A subunit
MRENGEVIYAVASDQSMNTKEYQGDNDDTINFSFEVHLLAGKLIPIVVIHSLGGSRANRHHTPNPQPGAVQLTQNEDPQAMHNPLGLPLALHQGRHKNPSQSQ